VTASGCIPQIPWPLGVRLDAGHPKQGNMSAVKKDRRLRYHPEHRRGASMPELHAVRLYELIGVERPLAEVERAVRAYVQGERPPVVGALQLTCSDEAEYEVAQVFRRDFVRALLPALHFDDKAPFHTANLGSRYEWGSAQIAEDHFAQAEGAEDWKLMLLKLNAHVGADEVDGKPAYGWLSRYGSPSACCGALAAVLAGDTRPFAKDLAEVFAIEGVDRLAQLRAAPEEQRALLTAITHARLQARLAMLDVQDRTPQTPTVTLILPSVTFNRRQHDTEVLLGVYVCDRRGPEPHDEYCGLGDRPEDYRLSDEAGVVRVEDPGMHTPRLARDHRLLIREDWDDRRAAHAEALDPRLKEAVHSARQQTHADHRNARLALKGLLVAAVAVAPVPAALALFSEGVLAVHYTAKAHRLAREAGGDPVARRMLSDLQGRIDELDPAQAQHLLDLLVAQYGA
jgi:hypothetical protein